MKTIKKIKELKGIIALCLMVAVAASLGGPGMVVAGIAGDPIITTTGLTVGSGSGAEWRPIVKAKWEMKGQFWDTKPTRTPDAPGGIWNDDGSIVSEFTGTDDYPDTAGAQFFAPGIWGNNMNYTVCAIATDPNGVADIDDVFADIYYPLNRKMHISMDPNEIDNPSGGCGAKIEQNTLYRLSKEQGIELFCTDIRTNSNNLVKFDSDYNWDEICNDSTGELEQELAYVYCEDKTLTWEDPAGLYDVNAIGHDSDGPGTALDNQFEYVAFTGFEIDFNSVNYPNVIQGVRSQAAGDRNFDPSTSSAPTVRNTGNTKLNLSIAQDDMDFDLRDSTNWNVAYDARVGTKTTDWSGLYDPFKRISDTRDPITGLTTDDPAGEYTELRETLNLSETEKMDFVILVEKWEHGTDYSYAGEMWLDANMAAFDSCCGS